MNKSFDVIIAGAGIVGLATAYKLLEKSPSLKVLIIEKESGVSKHQTGNNSGVIHSGIYYKPGSLKAVNCTRGYKMLLEFCGANKIPYDICGKVIVAVNDSEIPAMMSLYERGNQNGLVGLKILDVKELNKIEPYVSGVKGILVPQTGIVDYKVVSEKLFQLLLEKGTVVNFNEPLKHIDNNNLSGRTEIRTNKESYNCEHLVTCCGLQADRVAALNNKNPGIKIIPFRGEYYKIKKEKSYLVNNLIYPVPDPNFPFLGVHYTRKMNGEIEAGPNAVFAFKREGYKKTDINLKDLFESLTWSGFRKVAGRFMKTGLMEYYRSFSKSAFTRALQKLTPGITKSDLEPGGAGVRAQACSREGKLVDDFLFIENGNILHVCNAPSPAATSCLSIGDTIAGKVLK
jgi:(S)-2-hydroxyglutarate dehydrogenase